jgi:rifampin ADP-ribosylating transferase
VGGYPVAMTYAKDAAPPFYHGTRADLAVGDLLAPGFNSNYQEQKLSWIYFSGTLDAAIWGCELAKGPEGQEDARERIYVVEPTGPFEDDPNLTDKKRCAQSCRGHGEHCSRGNPTQSYRSRAPLRVTGEVAEWQGHSPERLKEMKDFLARLEAQGDMRIID